MPIMQIKLDEAKLKLTLHGVNLLGKNAKEAAKKELGASAIQMLGESSKKLRDNGSVATSFLVNSGKVKEYDKGYTVAYTASYAWIVEFGRKAGTMPPIQAIVPWRKNRKALHLPLLNQSHYMEQKRSHSFILLMST